MSKKTINPGVIRCVCSFTVKLTEEQMKILLTPRITQAEIDSCIDWINDEECWCDQKATCMPCRIKVAVAQMRRDLKLAADYVDEMAQQHTSAQVEVEFGSESGDYTGAWDEVVNKTRGVAAQITRR